MATAVPPGVQKLPDEGVAVTVGNGFTMIAFSAVVNDKPLLPQVITHI